MKHANLVIATCIGFFAGFALAASLRLNPPASPDLVAIGVDPCIGGKMLVFVTRTGAVSTYALGSVTDEALIKRTEALARQQRKVVRVPCSGPPVPTWLQHEETPPESVR